MRPVLLNIMVFGLGIAMILGVMFFFGFDAIVAQLMSVNAGVFALAVGVQALILALTALRLKLIAGSYPPLGFLKSMEVSLVGYVVNMITPFLRLGGEPVKMGMLKPIYGFSKSAAIITVDTFSELLSFYGVIMMAMAGALLWQVLPFSILFPFLVMFAFSAVLLTCFLAVCMNEKALRKVVGAIKRIVLRFKKIDDIDYVSRLKKSIKMLAKDRKMLLGVVIVTALLRMLEIVRMWLVFHALGMNVSFLMLVFAWSFILLVGMIPWLPGGLGLVEAGGVSAFMLFGIGASAAAGAMILDRLVSFWLVLIPGVMYISLVARDKIKEAKEENYERDLSASANRKLVIA